MAKHQRKSNKKAKSKTTMKKMMPLRFGGGGNVSKTKRKTIDGKKRRTHQKNMDMSGGVNSAQLAGIKPLRPLELFKAQLQNR